MSWMVTGGAGYIGAHVVRAFRAAGLSVVVLDDLSVGRRHVVPDDVPLVVGSVLDSECVRRVLREYDVTGVLHLAARKAVGESVGRPLYYWHENIEGMRRLLAACIEAGVDRVLFSSSAAVYGRPPTHVVTEETPTVPVSPYGETKLAGEWMLRGLAAAHGLRWSSLRYFNVAGAGAPALGDRSVANLVPMTFQALTDRRNPEVFGDDYDTRDGSCVRDYIHVVDLAEAHLAAARRIDDSPLGEVYNVGRGEEVTVKEVMAAVLDVTGVEFSYDVVGRRPGDPGACFADAAKIGAQLGWQPRLGLDEMVSSAWDAWQAQGCPAPRD